MSRASIRPVRSLAEPRHSASHAPVSRADFYREEFLKHKRCLQAQREFYSEHAFTKAEAAMTEALSKLDHLCNRCDCDHVISCLLRQFDLVTGLSNSNWLGPKKLN
jgi:hypothetical protein